ncbi:MAG: V-type ATPase subunit [Candidatus Aminicenantaceae bacterium]
MKRPSRLDYAYAVGRVRVLEKKLVDRAVFSEAAEEKDFPSAMKIVFDSGAFSEEMIKAKNSEDLDNLIEKEEEELERELDELLLEKEIFDIFLKEKKPRKALAVSKGSDYGFIKDFIKHKIDLANLKIFCRLKYLGAPKEKFEMLSLEGGFLDVKILLDNFDSPFPEIADLIQATPYEKLWKKGVDTLEEKETFIDLERGIEDFLMIYLKKAKHIVFGPEPVFAYGVAKRHELNLVRLLGIGTLSNIPPEILKKRISGTYV